MIFSLLDETTAETPDNGWVSWLLIGVLVVVLVVSMILMNRRSKKREQEAQALIDAVKPGNKVKTIGGICGIVVSVDPVEDTFVLETGNEESGKSYMKFVRQAILESDAVAPATKGGKEVAVSDEVADKEAALEETESAPSEISEPEKSEEAVSVAEEPATEVVPETEVAPETEPAAPKKKGGKKKQG